MSTIFLPMLARRRDRRRSATACTPGNSKRFGDVDFFDAAVGDRTAQNLRPEHVGQRDIDGVHRAAADFLFAFDSRTGNTDAANLAS